MKATFFIVGEKARKYPHLIRMMAERGHEIGLHNPVHRPNWFFAPWRLRREFDQMAEEIEALTGRGPVFYRPPWGIFNLWDYWYLRPYRMVLWTFLIRDWSRKSTPARMTEQILARVKHGAIILLHDGQGDNFRADPAAPSRMLAALADALERMRDWGYEYMTVGQLLERHNRSARLSWRKRCLGHSRMTIKAITVKADMTDSGVMTEHYSIASTPAPTNLTATAGDGFVTLNWSAVTGKGSVTYAVYKYEGTAIPGDSSSQILRRAPLPLPT